MGRVLAAAAVLAFIVALGAADANAGPIGYNHYFKWLRDADGDGIPNCLDPDWVRPRDGTGYQVRNGFGELFGFGPALFGPQNQNQKQYRNGDNKGMHGDNLRERSRKRDTTCIQ